MGTGQGGCRPLRGELLVFRKEEWTLRRADGKCDSLWLCVWVWCPLLVFLPVMSHLVGKTLREGIYGNEAPFGGGVFRQLKGVQGKPYPAFGVFRMPTAQNNQNAKAAYFEVAYSATLQRYLPKLETNVIFDQQFSFSGCILPIVSYVCEMSHMPGTYWRMIYNCKSP